MINGRRHRIIQQTHPAQLSDSNVETFGLPVSEVRSKLLQNNIPWNGCSIMRHKLPRMQTKNTASSCDTALESPQHFKNGKPSTSLQSKTSNFSTNLSRPLAWPAPRKNYHVTTNSDPSFRLTWKWGYSNKRWRGCQISSNFDYSFRSFNPLKTCFGRIGPCLTYAYSRQSEKGVT